MHHCYYFYIYGALKNSSLQLLHFCEEHHSNTFTYTFIHSNTLETTQCNYKYTLKNRFKHLKYIATPTTPVF